MTEKSLKAYEQVKEEYIPELDSQAFILRHKKTKAKIFVMHNEDENKVFTIGFRTPPKDSTGVAHILEHSILCGSRKFPLKDPFVELVKGSLNTFLNAMTYPDKTVYPVASCNDKDFHNLMDVYLDAVFHPNIYKNDKIFLQEGWHYELEDMDAPLKINGVVYNEMKGVYSSPESVLEAYTNQALFPDNTYAFESGGDPDKIPNLTYREFLDFHQKYYHPSNSYIYLYGNMDMEETLNWLDEAYLSDYEAKEVNSYIQKQQAFEKPLVLKKTYPISKTEESKETYLSFNSVVSDDLDRKAYVAFQILDYALLSAPGAPLKKAILDAKLAKDVLGGYESGILQPYFSVVAKDSSADKQEEFKAVIINTLKKLVEEKIPRRSLEAGLNFFEFKYREADYGSFPKGLMIGLQCFDSWLYEDTDPLMHLKYADTFAFLRKEIENNYFEKLIQEWLLENPHQVVLVMEPEAGLLEEKESMLEEKLAAYKESLSKEEKEELIVKTKELKLYQETPDTPEVLKLLPMLSREDLKKTTDPFINQVEKIDNCTLLTHQVFTSGIGYLRVMFDTAGLSEEELMYASLLKSVLGFVDTKHYSYQELYDEIHAKSGGIYNSLLTFDHYEEPDSFIGVFGIQAKVLYEKIDFAFAMIEEILYTSNLRDEKRLYEIIAQLKSRGQMRLLSSGHTAAVLRASSYFSTSAVYSECIGGLRFYQFIERMEASFDEEKEKIYEKLEALCKKLFVKERMMVNYTADEQGIKLLREEMKKFIAVVENSSKTQQAGNPPYFTCRKDAYTFSVCKLNEGFTSSSQVQYVGRCGNFKEVNKNLSYTGVLKILGVILNYDYLWTNLRVKGGAYGCMSGFGRNGDSYLVSYRDPNLLESNAVYEQIPEYLKAFEADERDMTKYVIGTFSNMDIPKTPRSIGERSLGAFLSQIPLEQLQKERNEILNASVEDIKNLAEYVEAMLKTEAICVIGNEKKVISSQEIFTEVKPLFNANFTKE